jgi:hypothetical protein
MQNKILRYTLLILVVVSPVYLIVINIVRKSREVQDQYSELQSRFMVVGADNKLSVAGLGSRQLERTDFLLLSAFSDRVAEINFSGRDLRKCPESYFSEFHNLAYLSLNHCAVNGASFKNISKLNDLEWLMVRNTGISDIELVQISKLPNLQRVYLGYNENISIDAIRLLTGIQSLETVEISGIGLSESEIEMLTEEFAALRVELKTDMELEKVND